MSYQKSARFQLPKPQLSPRARRGSQGPARSRISTIKLEKDENSDTSVKSIKVSRSTSCVRRSRARRGRCSSFVKSSGAFTVSTRSRKRHSISTSEQDAKEEKVNIYEKSRKSSDVARRRKRRLSVKLESEESSTKSTMVNKRRRLSAPVRGKANLRRSPRDHSPPSPPAKRKRRKSSVDRRTPKAEAPARSRKRKSVIVCQIYRCNAYHFGLYFCNDVDTIFCSCAGQKGLMWSLGCALPCHLRMWSESDANGLYANEFPRLNLKTCRGKRLSYVSSVPFVFVHCRYYVGF